MQEQEQRNELCFEGWSAENGNISGRCCCNCMYQKKITGHPWNKNVAYRSRIVDVIGYACTIPENPNITFFESKHGMCEMHDWRKT